MDKINVPVMLVKRHTTDQIPYRIVKFQNDFILYPEHWPPYVNGTGRPCDMLQGPCCCGAWHDLNEWGIESIKKEQDMDKDIASFI